MKLKGKVALVTGARRGIGKAIALGFAREGADVIVNARNPEGAASVAEEIEASGQRSGHFIADVSDPDAVCSMIEKVMENFGRIDILVNNAGVSSAAPFLELDLSEVKRIIETNVLGLFYVSQQVARAMVTLGDGGAILNISSLNASKPFFNSAHYNASKGAVTMLTRSMALELGVHKIRVNEICPASVETDINRKSMQDPKSRSVRINTTPLGRIGQPQDLVGASTFLCSDDASWITGASLATDGGLRIVPPLRPI
jgi:NAD(P)-dependent dehydrogenase (short-subunit alcohol dehydrogenase family)